MHKGIRSLYSSVTHWSTAVSLYVFILVVCSLYSKHQHALGLMWCVMCVILIVLYRFDSIDVSWKCILLRATTEPYLSAYQPSLRYTSLCANSDQKTKWKSPIVPCWLVQLFPGTRLRGNRFCFTVLTIS